MRRSTQLAIIAGVVLLAGIVLWHGAEDIALAFASAGPVLGLVVIARLIAQAMLGMAWSRLLRRVARPSLAVFALLRLVREGVNNLLPVAQIGGEFVGARLLSHRGREHAGLGGGRAGASIIVDMLLQVASQFLFTLIGLGLMIALGGGGPLVWSATIGLAIGAPAVIGFFFAQRSGGAAIVERLVLRLARSERWAALGGIRDLDAEVRAIWRDPRGISESFALHFATWIFGASEIYLLLWAMGHPVGIAEALVIESMGHAVRGAAFLVPGALGVQEGGFIALCAVYGVPADIAIALSLGKRVPDIVLGLPGLLLWQRFEAKATLQRNALGSASALPTPVRDPRAQGHTDEFS